MPKQITFNNNDQKLTKQIVGFQKSSGLPSFVSAVRKLCEDALQLKKTTKKQQRPPPCLQKVLHGTSSLCI